MRVSHRQGDGQTLDRLKVCAQRLWQTNDDLEAAVAFVEAVDRRRRERRLDHGVDVVDRQAVTRQAPAVHGDGGVGQFFVAAHD